jgi:hypothetical protein
LEVDKICEATLQTSRIKERRDAALCCNAEPQDLRKLTAYVHNVHATYPSTLFSFNEIALSKRRLHLLIRLAWFVSPSTPWRRKLKCGGFPRILFHHLRSSIAVVFGGLVEK